MSFAKYMLELVTEVGGEDGLLQDAIEWAILQGWVPITGDKTTDTDRLTRELAPIRAKFIAEAEHNRKIAQGVWEGWANPELLPT